MLNEVLALAPDRFVVVTDQRVAALHLTSILPLLERCAPTLVLSAKAGESSKTPAVLLSHAEQAVDWGVTRRSVVVTLGGGVPGNLGGLLAALLFRGMRFVHIPTTLMAMSDSVISLKQAVNLGRGKNLIGTYHSPGLVAADPALLETMRPQHWRSGMCEAIKNALAICPDMLDPLMALLQRPAPWSADDIGWLIQACISAKLRVMYRDHRERQAGLVLEYGHTIGHAIEITDLRARGDAAITHGEAVGLGMVASAAVSSQLGHAAPSFVDQHVRLIEAAGVSPVLPPGAEPAAIVAAIASDSKRGYLRQRASDEVGMILLQRPGIPLSQGELPLTPVPVALIREVLETLTA
jgi:3-dehydroquinate synthase/2-deoxy-scyllo-inosose synthase